MPDKTAGDELKKRLGPTWCFDHSCPAPCPTCDYRATALAKTCKCFDCKHLCLGESRAREKDMMQNLGFILHKCSCSSTIVCDTDQVKHQFGYITNSAIRAPFNK